MPTNEPTDRCMRPWCTHENVCNSRRHHHHHHSRMMIRGKSRCRSSKKKEKQTRKRKRERREEKRKKNEERQCVDVQRAERTRRMRAFFFLEGYKFCGLFETRRERERERSEPVGWRSRSFERREGLLITLEGEKKGTSPRHCQAHLENKEQKEGERETTREIPRCEHTRLVSNDKEGHCSRAQKARAAITLPFVSFLLTAVTMGGLSEKKNSSSSSSSFFHQRR